jgi:uncharacterized integral membrane protein
MDFGPRDGELKTRVKVLVARPKDEGFPMIRKIVTVLVLIPLALGIAMFAVSNRAPVLLGFDPFGAQPPMFAYPMPLFLALLTALILGVIVGGLAAWSAQRKWRRRARRLVGELKAAQADRAALRKQIEAVPSAARAQASSSIASIAYRHPSAA